RRGLEADLDGPGLGRVADEVALVLQRAEVGVHGRAGRQAHGLADLPHARRGAAAAPLGVDELEHLALPGGQVGHVRALRVGSISLTLWRAPPACALAGSARTRTPSEGSEGTD